MTFEELLTYNFYHWELLGRGYLYMEEEVDLEPPFYPFHHEYVFNALPEQKRIDDGRYPSILQSIGIMLSYPFRKRKQPSFEEDIDIFPTPYARPLAYKYEKLVELQVSNPRNTSATSLEPMYDLLVMLTACSYHLSFEIIGTDTQIIFQIVCAERDEEFVHGNIKTFFSDATITRKTGYLESRIFDKDTVEIHHYNLAQEFMRPLSTSLKHNRDSLMGVYSVLEQVGEGEMICIQLLFKGTSESWSQSIMTAVTDHEGQSFFVDDPNLVKQAREKIKDPLFAVSMRVLIDSNSRYKRETYFEAIEKGLTGINRDGNNSIGKAEDQVELALAYNGMFSRTTQMYGMILNAAELANLVHFPIGDPAISKLSISVLKAKLLPSQYAGKGLCFRPEHSFRK